MSTEFPRIPGLGLPIRTIFAIGRNYADHAKELGNPVPSEPVVFLKPLSSICFSGGAIRIPRQSERVDHEVELVVALGAGGKNIPESRALDYVAGYGVGIDATARDLQEKHKQKGLPWAIPKGFDTFAPISEFVPAQKVQDPGALEVTLEINGNLKQKGSPAQMLFSIPKLIHLLSRIYTLAPGDLIFTGTPPGVGPMQPGDRLLARLNPGLAELRLTVENEPAL